MLVCTERRTRVIEAFIALANAVIIIRHLRVGRHDGVAAVIEALRGTS